MAGDFIFANTGRSTLRLPSSNIFIIKEASGSSGFVGAKCTSLCLVLDRQGALDTLQRCLFVGLCVSGLECKTVSLSW